MTMARAPVERLEATGRATGERPEVVTTEKAAVVAGSPAETTERAEEPREAIMAAARVDGVERRVSSDLMIVLVFDCFLLRSYFVS